MAWTLHLLVWLTVTTSAYKCKHTSYTGSDSDSHQRYDYASQEPIGIPNNRAYERMNSRSVNISPASSYSPNVPDDVKTAQLRIAEQSATRSENESKVLSWKPYAESRRGQNNDKIVFPGPTSTATSGKFELEIPEHCKALGICDDIPNYPKEQAKKIIEELSGQGRFQKDKLELPDVPDITQRLGPAEDNIELCGFEEKIVYPKAAVDSSGKWYIVLNQDDDPVQGFKVEICENVSTKDENTSELHIDEGEWKSLSGCSKFAVFVPGYEGRCKQKFVYRKMTVLRPDDGSPLERSLKVPSCCSCVARAIIT